MRVVEFLRGNQLRLAGLLGAIGMALGVAADIASGYSLRGTTTITTAFSVLTLKNLGPFLLSRSTTPVVVGHYVALLGIPLGLFGFWHVYQAIKPAGWTLSRSVWFLGVFAYVAGTVFHSTFAFITFGVQAADTAPPAADPVMRTMLKRFALVFEPLGMLLVGVMVVALVLIFFAIAFRETLYPRWFALANPLVIQAVTGLLALVSPLELRVFFIVTAYNLSLLLFYAISTALLWNSQLLTPSAPGNEAT